MSKMYVLEDEEYILNLPYHLAEAAQIDNLYKILTEFEFIEYKVDQQEIKPLIEDYALAFASKNDMPEEKEYSLKLIQRAIRLSENVLLDDTTQLPGQLWGRLQCFGTSEIQYFLEQVLPRQSCWLRPLTCCLTSPEGSLIRTLNGHNQPVTSLTITPDGRFVISGSRDNTLQVWDLEAGKEELTLMGHSGAVLSITTTIDGQWVISGSVDQTIKVWNLETGKERFTLKGHHSSVSTIAVTSDGHRLVSGAYDQTIKVWNLETGEEKFTITGHEGTIFSVAITSDDKWIISGSEDRMLKVCLYSFSSL